MECKFPVKCPCYNCQEWERAEDSYIDDLLEQREKEEERESATRDTLEGR